MLADIVAKNGNLLLNVVQRPDGSLDPQVEQDLGDLAAWNKVNGEAIFGTRPWLVYGEGAVKTKGGHFKEDFAYTSKDIRFTTRGKTLYAIMLGWPEDGKALIRSLRTAADGANKIFSVGLLGGPRKLKWVQTAEGLVVELPSRMPCEHAFTLKIAGVNWHPVEVAEIVEPVKADARGNLTLLAAKAELHGSQIGTEERGGEPNIAFWDNPEEWVSWKVQFAAPGKYQVTASTASIADTEFVLEVANQKLSGKWSATGDWATFRPADMGQIKIDAAGEQMLSLRPKSSTTWRSINLRYLKLTGSN
jgi:alpha-L-fucosidase